MVVRVLCRGRPLRHVIGVLVRSFADTVPFGVSTVFDLWPCVLDVKILNAFSKGTARPKSLVTGPLYPIRRR